MYCSIATCQRGGLKFTTNLAEGIKEAQIIFLALPTPPGEDGSADLKYILKVADDLGPLLEHYAVIVDKSTVPVGTAEKVRAAIAKNAKVEFDVVSNPGVSAGGGGRRGFYETRPRGSGYQFCESPERRWKSSTHR